MNVRSAKSACMMVNEQCLLLWKRSFLAVAAVCAISTICCAPLHPSDQSLEQNLRNHRAEFETLVRMLDEDAEVVRIVDNRVYFREGYNRQFPQERLKEYHHLFKKLGIAAGIHRNGDTVRLIASNKGLFVPSSEKSYVYIRRTPSPLVESLDRVINSDQGDQTPVYKKVFDNWYIYYESW